MKALLLQGDERVSASEQRNARDRRLITCLWATLMVSTLADTGFQCKYIRPSPALPKITLRHVGT